MNTFEINGRLWLVKFSEPYSEELIDRSGGSVLATTDPHFFAICLSDTLKHDLVLLRTVLLHELGHAAMISYNMLDELHRMVKPRYWVDIEEWICNFLADYGSEIFNIANDILTKMGDEK